MPNPGWVWEGHQGWRRASCLRSSDPVWEVSGGGQEEGRAVGADSRLQCMQRGLDSGVNVGREWGWQKSHQIGSLAIQ